MDVVELDERSPVRLNGALLRFALRARGWSQARLATELGINESTVSRALGPDGVTTLRVARKIMDAFEGRLRMEEVLDIPGMTPDNPPGLVPGP